MLRTKAKDEKYILNLLGKFGNLEKYERDSTENNLHFIFMCDVKKVTEDSLLRKFDKVPLIIKIRNDGTVFIFLFCLFKKRQYGSNIMKLINGVNSIIMNGKFYIDDDGDINWNCSFDAQMVNETAIKKLLESMLQGAVMLVAEVSKNE